MLAKNPEDEILLKLHQDLSQVIQLTHDLATQKGGGGGGESRMLPGKIR